MSQPKMLGTWAAEYCKLGHSMPELNLDGLNAVVSEYASAYILKAIKDSIYSGDMELRIVLCSEPIISVRNELTTCLKQNAFNVELKSLDTTDAGWFAYEEALLRGKVGDQIKLLMSRYHGLPAIYIKFAERSEVLRMVPTTVFVILPTDAAQEGRAIQ